MAGPLTDEPRPRASTGDWKPFEAAIVVAHRFARPVPDTTQSFSAVLESRRSRLGSVVTWEQIADLLWFAVGARGYEAAGRAGLPVQWSATPSAGGLSCLHVVCIAETASRPRLYDSIEHRLLEIEADGEAVTRLNREAVEILLGRASGCTLRLMADWSKLSAAYENAESLMFRDAGALTTTLMLCATWLGLTACPLGFVGQSFIEPLGLPNDRFRAVGAIQIGRAKK